MSTTKATPITRLLNKLSQVTTAFEALGNKDAASMAADLSDRVSKLTGDKATKFSAAITSERSEDFAPGTVVKCTDAALGLKGSFTVVETIRAGGESGTGRGGKRYLKLTDAKGNPTVMVAALFERA